jgi:hypothetical protein
MWKREAKSCPVCGVTSREKTLIMPERLPNAEAKRYDGPMYCLSCSPRFQALPRPDFGKVA